MANKRDYYEVLGVDKNADEATIKKAYRKLAKEYHPDSHPGDAECEAKFKEASEAYAVLIDSEKRRQYDQFGHAAFEGGAGGAGGFNFNDIDLSDIFGGFGGIFNEFFGGGGGGGARRGPMRGANIRVAVSISFEEAAFGVEKQLELNLKETCKTCSGSGAKPGTSKQTCTKCGGKGKVVMNQRSIFGMVQQVTTCPECGGEGEIIKEKCSDCRGTGYISKMKKISVNIPAGIDNGEAVRVRDMGEPGVKGGPRGDLLVEVRVAPHKIFQRRDYNIFSSAPITYAQAALGGDVLVDTLDGKVYVNVKPGTQTDTQMRLRGKGVPSLRNKDQRGDHYITFIVQVPTDLSKEAKEALKKFDELTGNSLKPDPNGDGGNKTGQGKSKKKGFFSKD